MAGGCYFDYDDDYLEDLWFKLSEKQQVIAMKSAIRTAARRFRKAAVSNFRSVTGGKKHKPVQGGVYQHDMEEGIRCYVFSRKIGFRVAVGSTARLRVKGLENKRRTFLQNAVMRWVEDGTQERRTKSNAGKHTRQWYRRRRSKHSTGKMYPYKFLLKTKYEKGPSITEEIHNDICDSIIRTSKRYGCKV